MGEMEAPGWGGGCYQLSFQQDAFEGRQEVLVHTEALEPCSCSFLWGPLPAIPSTEHVCEAHRAQMTPSPDSQQSRKRNRNLIRGADRRKMGASRA